MEPQISARCGAGRSSGCHPAGAHGGGCGGAPLGQASVLCRGWVLHRRASIRGQRCSRLCTRAEGRCTCPADQLNCGPDTSVPWGRLVPVEFPEQFRQPHAAGLHPVRCQPGGLPMPSTGYARSSRAGTSPSRVTISTGESPKATGTERSRQTSTSSVPRARSSGPGPPAVIQTSSPGPVPCLIRPRHRFTLDGSWAAVLTGRARNYLGASSSEPSANYQEVAAALNYLAAVGLPHAHPDAVRYRFYTRLSREPAWVADTSGQWSLGRGLSLTAGAGYYRSQGTGSGIERPPATPTAMPGSPGNGATCAPMSGISSPRRPRPAPSPTLWPSTASPAPLPGISRGGRL